MRLRVFRGAAMADAMAKVRTELGAEALILNTRRVAGGIEITAAIEPHPETLPPQNERLTALAWHGVPRALHQTLALGDLTAAIAGALNFGMLPLNAGERPVMLTGAPGAGKTLTIARLATRLVMGGGVPMVITTDSRRAGATEQLAAFTRLLGVPLLVANDAAGLMRALAQRPRGASVLIDTAGTDPRDRSHYDEFRELALAAGAHVSLVLPAGLDRAEAADLAVAHAECNAASMIVTRIDLARRLGSVLAAAAASHLPLTEAGIGPGAADGLVQLTPALLAARLSVSEGRNHAT